MPRGRPKALSLGRATKPSQRRIDDLLLDIARTKQKIKSVRELVTVLRWQPKYHQYPYETLRNDVTEAMHWAASRLYRLKLLRDDVMLGFDPAATFVNPKTGKVAGTGLFDEAIVNRAIAAAQARPLKLNQDQFKKTLKVLRECVRELLTQKQ
jgi:hypothetical protein